MVLEDCSRSLETGDVGLIYEEYKNTISDLIANIEVYEHDLPKTVMTQIAEIFQSVAFYENEENPENKARLWKALKATNSGVKKALYKHAICLFIKKIQEYKKMFRQYKYKGVMLENKNLHLVLKAEEQKITELFAGELRKCYSGKIWMNLKHSYFKDCVAYIKGLLRVYFNPSFSQIKNEPYIPINDLPDDMNLEDIYEDVKTLLKTYQENCSNVINNGKAKSLKMLVFNLFSTWVIPFISSLMVVIKLFDIIKEIICK